MSGGTDGTGLNRSDNRASYVVGVLNELCEHLQQIGIRATVVWDDPSPEAIHYKVEHGTFVILESPLGCVKVEGRSIDAIRVCIESEISWGYDNFDHWPILPRGTSIFRVTYNINYFVHGLVENLEDELEAETRPIKGGLFEKKVTGFEWKGGRLAGILNADFNLKDMLLKTGSPDIVVEPHKEKISSSTGMQLILKFEASDEMQSHKEEQYVEITASIIVTEAAALQSRIQAFPSSEAFEAYDRIARHIRSIITYSPPPESHQSLQPPTPPNSKTEH